MRPPHHLQHAQSSRHLGDCAPQCGHPTSMRGPGAVPGLFALESAMDELAVKLNIDPIKLRLLERAPEGRRPQPAFLLAPYGGVS